MLFFVWSGHQLRWFLQLVEKTVDSVFMIRMVLDFSGAIFFLDQFSLLHGLQLGITYASQQTVLFLFTILLDTFWTKQDSNNSILTRSSLWVVFKVTLEGEFVQKLIWNSEKIIASCVGSLIFLGIEQTIDPCCLSEVYWDRLQSAFGGKDTSIHSFEIVALSESKDSTRRVHGLIHFF